MKKSFAGYFLIFDLYIVTYPPLRNPFAKINANMVSDPYGCTLSSSP